MKTKSQAFTLVEVIITLTILSLIFSSVMSVFIYYSTLGAKVETNRLLQSNIKNISEHIRQDIRDNGIVIAETSTDDGHYINTNKNYAAIDNALYSVTEDTLYVGESMYYIGKDDTGIWIKVDADEFDVECGDIQKNCTLLKNTGVGDPIPLSNSWVSFKNLYFQVSKDSIPKVTMNFEMNIANEKGIKTGLIESSSIKMQLTMSEKLLDKNK